MVKLYLSSDLRSQTTFIKNLSSEISTLGHTVLIPKDEPHLSELGGYRIRSSGKLSQDCNYLYQTSQPELLCQSDAILFHTAFDSNTPFFLFPNQFIEMYNALKFKIPSFFLDQSINLDYRTNPEDLLPHKSSSTLTDIIQSWDDTQISAQELYQSLVTENSYLNYESLKQSSPIFLPKFNVSSNDLFFLLQEMHWLNPNPVRSVSYSEKPIKIHYCYSGKDYEPIPGNKHLSQLLTQDRAELSLLRR